MRALSYIAGDHDDLRRPFAARILAVRRESRGSTASKPTCDGFCKRALLNGLVERVIVQAIEPQKPTDNVGISWRLEKRGVCPDVSLPPGDDIAIESESRDFGAKTVDEILQLRIANGDCLIRETVPITDADTIITVQNVHRGATEYSAGLNPFADTVTADRITVEKKDNGAYREIYRWIGVVTYKLWPIFAPTIVNGYGFDTRAGLGRGYEFKNIPGRFYEKPDWSGFVTKTLGMNLALQRDGIEVQLRDKTAEILSRPGPITKTDQTVIDANFDGFLRSRMVKDADYPPILKLLDDSRVQLASSAWAAVKYAANPPGDYFERIANAAFRRLRELDPKNMGQQASHLGSLIKALPKPEILKHRSDLEWLARQDQLRALANPALVRLSDFGADASPTLLFLIDDADRTGDRRSNNWQHPYLQGLIGLCELGPQASGEIQPIFDRIDAGRIALWGSYYALTIRTLAAMGADAETIWRHLQSRQTNVANTEERIVGFVTGRRDCSY